MSHTDTWLAWLESRVGESEHPPGSNCCDICHEYGSLGVTCYAWCCAEQDLALEHTFGERLLGTASVGQAKANAVAGHNGLLWIPRESIENGEDLRVGDLPCYDYGGNGDWNNFHIEGIVNPYTNKRFQTIGGNRQNRCDYWWNTLNSSVMGFIRPPFETTGLGSTPTTQGDDDMAWSDEEKRKVLDALEAHGTAIARLEDSVHGGSGILPIVEEVRGGLLPAAEADKPLGQSSIDNQIKMIRRALRKVAGALTLDTKTLED